MARLLLIDEGTMLDKYLLEALDRTLRDLMRASDKPFGGKVIIIAGDFRQCIPVVKGAQRPAIIKHAINKSHLWKLFKILELSVNMRVRASGDPDLEAFDKWTLSIGNGEKERLRIPGNMVATQINADSKNNLQGKSMEEFCDKIFPHIEDNISDRNWITGRVILAATNKEVQMLNDVICSKLPGSNTVLRSSDEIGNTQDQFRFNTEYLNSLLPNGFPPHELNLKPGMPLMLLRNLSPKQGLCNGTKLIFEKALDNKLLLCKVSDSDNTVLIPRITFIPKPGDFGMEWSRRQFPVKPGFSMTFNKSQGNIQVSLIVLLLDSNKFFQDKL